MANCTSLAGSGLTLSTTNVTSGTTVHLSCDDFGHRPSGSVDKLECLGSGNWSSPVPSCEWSWNFKKKDEIIFATSVAAVTFLIVVTIVAIIAYLKCYRRRDEMEDGMFSSQPSSSPAMGFNGPYNEREFSNDPYITYQDVQDKLEKFEGYQMNGTPENPWLGYIPRPKVYQEPVYST